MWSSSRLGLYACTCVQYMYGECTIKWINLSINGHLVTTPPTKRRHKRERRGRGKGRLKWGQKLPKSEANMVSIINIAPWLYTLYIMFVLIFSVSQDCIFLSKRDFNYTEIKEFMFSSDYNYMLHIIIRVYITNLSWLSKKFFLSKFSYTQPGAKIAIDKLQSLMTSIALKYMYIIHNCNTAMTACIL